MKIHTIHDLSNAYVINILQKGFNKITDTNIIANYHPDLSDNPANIFYLLKNGRYKDGAYYVVDDNEKYVCSAGWHPYKPIPDVALVLSRMFIAPEMRAKYIVGNSILPIMIQETMSFEKVWGTCNEHNKIMYKWLVRNETQNEIGNWPDIYKNFKPIGQKIINNTLQYVLEYQREKK